jgi:hypothetical protein
MAGARRLSTPTPGAAGTIPTFVSCGPPLTAAAKAVPSKMVNASLITGSAAPVTEICHHVPTFGPDTGTKRIAFPPGMAFAFSMNWRSVPCCWIPSRVGSSSNASPRVLVTTFMLKPELIPATLRPDTVTFVTCSAVIRFAASSEPNGERPLYRAPAAAVNVPAVAAPAAP